MNTTIKLLFFFKHFYDDILIKTKILINNFLNLINDIYIENDSLHA